MALHFHSHCLITLFSFSLLTFSLSQTPPQEGTTLPGFAFSWLNDINTFRAGDIATIKIKVLENSGVESNGSLNVHEFRPVVTVNGKSGNSSYVSGVFLVEIADDWRIVFTPIMAGLFNVIITEERFKVLDSSLHFEVVPGNICPSVCSVSWMSLVTEFTAGAKASLLVLPKDAFGNNISSTNETLGLYNYTISVLYANGTVASTPKMTFQGWNEFGFVTIEFIAFVAGEYFLELRGQGQNLDGSPLPFKVYSGVLNVSNSVAKWKFDSSTWQILSKVEVLIHQLDTYGNLVPGLFEFDADVVEKETNLSIPISDFRFEEVTPGIQLLSFTAIESGNFLLTISDAKHNKSISNMPSLFNVFPGYCNETNSIINGTGLNSSTAGEVSEFAIYLNDLFNYSSPVEVDKVRVQIAQENDSQYVWPGIYPMQLPNVSGMLKLDAASQTDNAPAPTIGLNNNTGANSSIHASAFKVIYTPEKSGTYGIHVYCGNILLNGGRPLEKEVRAGEVNMSLSGIMKFDSKVAKLIKNDIVVKLSDSFNNPVLSQQMRLKIEITSINSSAFSTWMFTNNNDGTYTGQYSAKDVGTYEICASLEGNRFNSCPFVINVYSDEYFPKANDDIVSIWENESIAFDVLANDYFAGGNASIMNFSEARHGSVLQYGHLLRYTPYRSYYGDDCFLYTMSDVNGNQATAFVNIQVLNAPPQFVSFPTQLDATEDVISPKFGGYSGLRIAYSDAAENISVTMHASSGNVSLSPMVMEFWQPALSVSRGTDEAKDLFLQGHLEIINSALQSFQYHGKENFSGGDTIRVSARNRNGSNDLDIPVFVEPINDPPFIRVPEYIVLRFAEEKLQLYDKERDKFDFYVGDPDLVDFPGGDSVFEVAFSVEVDDGYLITSLPAKLINTTELKLKYTYLWQPLQTYITISKHFTVQAIGIRFWGTISECNSVMEHLFYRGGDYGAVLTIALNDLGNYGCYPDCVDYMSFPLYTEASVNLIRRRPMSSSLDRTIASVIIVQLILTFSLGAVLLFFTCKCALLLMIERANHNLGSPGPSANDDTKQTSGKTSPVNAAQAAIHSINRCFRRIQPSGFRQRSVGRSRKEETTTNAYGSPSFFDGSQAVGTSTSQLKQDRKLGSLM